MNRTLLFVAMVVLATAASSLALPTGGAITICSGSQLYTDYAGVYCRMDAAGNIQYGTFACTDPSLAGGSPSCAGITCIGYCPRYL